MILAPVQTPPSDFKVGGVLFRMMVSEIVAAAIRALDALGRLDPASVTLVKDAHQRWTQRQAASECLVGSGHATRCTLLGFSREILIRVLRNCDHRDLSRVEQSCTVMSGRARRSPVKDAVLMRLRAQFPGATLNVRSWTALLGCHECAALSALKWGDARELYEVGEEQDALQLGDSEVWT